METLVSVPKTDNQAPALKRWKGPTDTDAVEKLLAEVTGELAFDIGANVGMTSMRFARNFSKVIAFEPCRESFDILQTEVPVNVICSANAISEFDGQIELKEAASSITTGQLVSMQGLHWGNIVGSRKLPAISLQSAVDIYGPADFVKIDTEGHEVEAVAGGVEFLSKHHPGLVIEIHYLQAEKEIKHILPFYEFVKVEHEALRADSPIRQNHFWLVSDGLF